MTKTVLLGLTLVAVLTMVVAFPAVADAITGIKNTEIKEKNDEIKKLRFHLDSKVPKHPFGRSRRARRRPSPIHARADATRRVMVR